MRGERAWGDGSASGVHGEGPTQGCGGAQGTRGAHVEHAVSVRDAGRVEAERLVERPRVLPSRKVGMHREGPTQGCGPRAHAERTENMFAASVTLDMSKLSAWLNAFACCRVERRACNAGRGTAREA